MTPQPPTTDDKLLALAKVTGSLIARLIHIEGKQSYPDWLHDAKVLWAEDVIEQLNTAFPELRPHD